MEKKKKVFKEVSELVDDKTILASNTSALSVSEMAKQAKDPSKVVGFHFFNPVHRMPLVEVIAAKQTSSDTIVSALALAKKLNKIPILVKDSSGFVVNRILLHYINEAGYLLEETGDIEGIDRALEAFGMPMGPFRLSDEVGLDVGSKVLHILQDTFGDRFASPSIFEKVMAEKWLGKKSGKGFYLHGKSKHKNVNPQISQMLSNTHFNLLNEEQAYKRLIYSMINEAACCLEDGIVQEADAIDVGMIFGAGFPAFRGGLLRYADAIGLQAIINTLNEFSNRFNSNRFRPSTYLIKLAKKDKGFYS